MALSTYEDLYNGLVTSLKAHKQELREQTETDFTVTFDNLRTSLDESRNKIRDLGISMMQQLNDKDDEIRKINEEKQAEITRLLAEHADALTKKLNSADALTVENIKSMYALQTSQALQKFQEQEKIWETKELTLQNSLHENKEKLREIENEYYELLIELQAQDTTQKQSFQNSPDHENAQDALQKLKDIFTEQSSIIEPLNEKLKGGSQTDVDLSDLLYQYKAFFNDIGNVLTTFKIMRNEESQRKTSKAGKERPIIYEKGVPRYKNICGKTTGLYGISEESLIASDKATCVPKEFFVIDT